MRQLLSRRDRWEIGPYLDQLLTERWLAACPANRIRHPGQLPIRLEHCVQSLPLSAAWRAYGDSARLYCAIGRAVTSIGNEPGSVALEVYFLDATAAICAAAVWECSSRHGWRLVKVLEPNEASLFSELKL